MEIPKYNTALIVGAGGGLSASLAPVRREGDRHALRHRCETVALRVKRSLGEILRRGGKLDHQSPLRKAARIGAHIAASAWLAMWPLSEGIST